MSVTVAALNAYEPVDGGQVTFTAPVIGASAVISGSPATIYSGTVSVTATANNALGAYTVSASTTGASPVSFSLENIINSAPTDIAISNQSILENQPTGTLIGSLSTTDPDTGNTFTYALAAGTGDTDNASFSVTGNELLSAASFDFETKSSYSVRIRATDNGNLWYEKVFTITITDVDDSSPSVLAITRAGSSPTSAASVDFIVTFSESVTGVDMTDFTLTTSGISGAAVSGVSGSGSVYTVTVSTGSGNGTIRLDATDDDSIIDGASNPLGGAGAGNGNFTVGEMYTITKVSALFLPVILR